MRTSPALITAMAALAVVYGTPTPPDPIVSRRDIGEGLTDAAHGLVSDLTGGGADAVGGLVDVAGGAVSGVVDTVGGAVDGVVDAVGGAVNGVVGTGGAVVNGVTGVVGDLVGALLGLPIDIIGGLVSTVENLLKSLLSGVLRRRDGGVSSDVTDNLKDLKQALTAAIGTNGITDTAKATLSEIVNTIDSVLSSPKRDGALPIAGLVAQLTHLLETLLSDLTSLDPTKTVTDLISSVQGLLSQIPLLGPILDGLLDTVGGIIPGGILPGHVSGQLAPHSA